MYLELIRKFKKANLFERAILEQQIEKEAKRMGKIAKKNIIEECLERKISVPNFKKEGLIASDSLPNLK